MVGDDCGFGLVGELSVFVDVDAIEEKFRGERDDFGG